MHDPFAVGVIELVGQPLVLQQAVAALVQEQGFATPVTYLQKLIKVSEYTETSHSL